MQESIDDALWVLKSHAESTSQRNQSLPHNPSYVQTPQFPPGLTDQLQNAPLDNPGSLEATTNAMLNNLANARGDPALLGKVLLP